MFNRRLFAITGGGEVPVPVFRKRHLCLSVINGWAIIRSITRLLRYPKTLLDLGCTGTPCKQHGKTTADCIAK